MYVIDFIPPLCGFENTFNTFRIGLSWSKKIQVGDVVGLLDKKHSKLFGAAIVTGIHTGRLADMADLYAAQNHNQLGQDAIGAPDRLKQRVLKLYGPRIVSDDKKTTVIELRRIDNDDRPRNQDT